ncbi:hypothetical protein ACQP00_43125 [Dactylosporangium sp. CS-047395]|uniref:hypothetical protein n=1 Tax=Dactylosporangium sp. CS-047395 TaxID=3239936 RepID=UPI003D8AEF6E
MSEMLAAVDLAEWRDRLEAMLAARRLRCSRRAADRASFAEARRRGLEARQAERLALLDREAATAEVVAGWARR